jgi:hypothetical protein
MKKGAARLREQLVVAAQLPVHVDAAATPSDDARGEHELGVDRNGTAVAHEDPRRHRREAVPRREQPARLVERGGDEAAVDDSRAALVPLVEAEAGFVALGSLLGRLRQPDALGVVAAPPTGRIVMRRDPHPSQTFSNVPKRSSWS